MSTDHSPSPMITDITLPEAVESMIATICAEQSQPQPGVTARRELQSLGENQSLEILNTIRRSKISKTFHGFIIYLARLKSSQGSVSPLSYARASQSPSTSSPGKQGSPTGYTSAKRALEYPNTPDAGMQGSPSKYADVTMVPHRPPVVGPDRRDASHQKLSPQFLALEGLEFRRLFLILSYIGRSKLEDVATVEEIQAIRAQSDNLSMGAFELLIWTHFGQHICEKTDRLRYRNWDPLNRCYYYHCHVYADGSYSFKGPYLNSTTTLLQRVLDDDNVLVVKFVEEEADISRSKVHSTALFSRLYEVADKGIWLGQKCYRFFAFKDGGKEGKKKDPTASPVKCYFVNMESITQYFRNKSTCPENISVHEARCTFMHVHKVSNMSAYMARFSLILSKTIQLEVNLDGDDIVVEDITDTVCKNEDGSDVYGEDGKLLIQTDGTGFISEDLALRCPRNCFKGSLRNDPSCERYLDVIKVVDKSLEPCLLRCHQSEPPLLIQFRMFHKGRAIKGTVLVNKQLPIKTIQVRPSMIKVERDPDLVGVPSINSFEIVSTSNRPKKPYFSRFLIALLHYGGVPRAFFTKILDEAVADTENVLSNMRGALRVALIHGGIDYDHMVARMLLSGIPLEEPYIQWRLPILAREEKKSLKEGRLPITESFYLMGTADPAGCLEEDEVSIIHDNGQISGDVLVYRNPGIHFGDIRLVKATPKKALEDIVGNSKYGIFFSTKGRRSLADKMAGGDYDGDMFWVSRNPELLRYFVPSEPWTCMSNGVTKKPTEFCANDLEKVLFRQFFNTRFQPSKSTGVAADSWLSYMDRIMTLGHECVDERNLLKEKMLKLVDIYYDALDAPKKGLKVEVPPELIPKRYPHYMGRGDMFTYNSKSVLGEIFDRADELKLENPSIQVWKLPSFEVDIPKDRFELWEDQYKAYRAEMSNALQLAGEAKKEAAEEVMKKYRLALYAAEDFESSSRSWEEIRIDALAIYHASYNYAIMQGKASYCNFAWGVAGSALLKAFVDALDEKPVTCLLSVLKQVLV